MNRLNFSSWSINVKIFFIILGAMLTLNLINTPLSIEIFNDVNRQAFRQVVTETALRQKEAIDEDFSTAFTIFEAFQNTSIPYISVTQWLTRSDPQTEGFGVNATQTKAAAERAIETEILSASTSLFRQAWLIDVNGNVISNIAGSFGDTRYTIELAEYADASDSPAHRTGLFLAQSGGIDRQIDVVVEEVRDRLSIQLVAGLFTNNNNFVGTLVIELNNVSLITNNFKLSNAKNETYSFIGIPNISDHVIALGTTDKSWIDLKSQAFRSSLQISEAQFYTVNNRRVIGFYTPLFEQYQPNMILVVELDEATALRNVALSVLNTSGPTLLLQIVLLSIAIAIINRLFVHPITVITDVIRRINTGEFQSAFPIDTGDDEIGRLAETVIELRQHLHGLTTDISTRLETRSRDLQVTQEIGQVAISETDLDQLMTQVVNLIVERFQQIYHAQIFLIEGNYAVLKASTGQAGKQLLANGHRLGVGSLSVIGQVTQHNQTIIARDTAISEVHRRNEFLRDTRAELAIPMRLGTQVIGVLDVQSTMRDAFDEDLVMILETMTDQITIAVENARLYKQSQRRIQEYEKATRQRSQHNWEDFMYSQRTHEIVSRAGAQSIGDFTEIHQKATETQHVTIGDMTSRNTIPIAIPVIIRGQVLGVIEWEASANELNQNHILLAEELASRLAISLDNARLVQAGRQTVENERIINTISAKISGQTDIEQILRTAIQEVGQALRAPRVNIQLHKPNANHNGNVQVDNGHQPTSDDD